MGNALGLTSALLCFAAMAAMAVDWAAMEAAYRSERERIEERGCPSHYAVQAADGMLVFDARPEFGIGMHEVDQRSLDILREAHVRFVRITLYWNQIETGLEPGAYDREALEAWDERIALFERNSVVPLVVVHGNPPGVSFATRTESYRRFARFMGTVAARWPYVRYWELWNEMDASFTDLFGAGVEPEVPMFERGRYYSEMLRLTAPAIRAANPEALVVTGGMDNFSDFPRGIYEAGGAPFFDIMNLHTYGIPSPWSFVQRGVALRELMAAYGDGQKPLWNTEFGVDAGSMVQAWGLPETDAPGFWDANQKEMLSDCIRFNLKAGLYQKMFAYQFRAGNEIAAERIAAAGVVFPPGHTVDDYGFGFMRRDGRTPRPVWDWILEYNVNAPARLGATRQVQLMTESRGEGTAVVIPLDPTYPTRLRFRMQ